MAAPHLLRPEGSEPADLNLSRRGLAGLFFGGFALAALSAEAAPIVTDTVGLAAGEVIIPTRNSQMPAYYARPDRRGREPVVIVVSEVFGVHEYIRDVCRRLAKSGYFAVAPAFFHRAGDPAPLTDFAEIRKLVGTATNEQVMGDIAATLSWVKAQPNADGRRIGITGFCWGGAVTWMAAARFRDFRAGVAWYGRLTAPAPADFLGGEQRPWPIDVVGQLNAPVLGLYAEKDQGIPLESVERMRTALRAAGKRGSDIVVYPGAQHGFHADYRAAHNAVAAEDGWRRLLDHFRRNGLRARALEPERRRAA
ncbi:MAG: dienelactone hydrolase family protein [Proteobacteria bacterium]|nr:dienelactone hydrolase family protein [Pseudomonadota bacterium]